MTVMNTHRLIAAFCAAALLMAGSVARADVPKLINYQGKLTNASGAVLGSGVYTLRFTLHNKKAVSEAGDTLVWGATQQVAVVEGVFHVVLGAAGATPVAGAAVNDLAFAFGDAERYLETTIVSGPEITSPQTLAPRQQLASVPYAVEAFNGVPPGTVVPYFGTTAPAGWELCHGQAVERTGKYARLFASIGTSCGAPNASTFNLPDLRGRFLRGVDGPDESSADRDPDSSARLAMLTGGNTGNSVGSVQGFKTSMPLNPFITEKAGIHDHATHGQGPISHGFGNNYAFLTRTNNSFGGGGGSAATFGGRPTVDTTMKTSREGEHTHEITGGDNETRPINAACNFIIKY